MQEIKEQSICYGRERRCHRDSAGLNPASDDTFVDGGDRFHIRY